MRVGPLRVPLLVCVASLVTVTAQAGLTSGPPYDGARAQDLERLVGRPIATVALEVEGQPETSAAVLALLTVRQGELVRVEAIRDSIERLYTAGRFEDVEVLASDGPAGVNLLFRMRRRHPIDHLEFEGEKTGLSKAELDRRVRDRYGGLPSAAQPSAVVGVVRGFLADEGYLNAVVTHAVEETHTPHRATLVLRIDAGPQTRIRDVQINGASPYSRDQILQRLGTTPGSAYRERAIDAKLAELRDELSARGYYEAIATMVRPEVPPGTTEVDLALTVDAGRRVRLEVDRSLMPAGDVEDYIPIRRENSADDDLLTDSRRRIELGLQREGYMKASAPFAKRQEGDQLIITFTIDRGLRYRIERVEVAGNQLVSTAEIETQFLVRARDIFDPEKVSQGVTRVRAMYGRRGFYLAKLEVQPPEEVPTAVSPPEGLVVLRLLVTEGPPGAVAAIDIEGERAIREDELRGKMRSRVGEPYVKENDGLDHDILMGLYLDRGFQTASVTITPEISPDGRAISLHVAVVEGPQIIVNEIRVVGNRHVSERTITDAMTLKPGGPLSQTELVESQRRLYALGILRNVRIFEEPRLSGETRANLVVIIEESPRNTIDFGGGVEAERRTHTTSEGTIEDRLDVAPRGFFEIARRNLGGKNRSIDFFSRVSLKSRDIGEGWGFSEYRVSTTYREPRAFRSDTDVLFTATSEQAIRQTFKFLRRSLTGEGLRRVSDRIALNGRYALEFTRLFDEFIPEDERPLIDRLFPQVRLSILSSGVVWDRRNSPVDPSRGTLMSGNAELAVRSLGSEVGYVKTFVQTAAFHRLQPRSRVVLAGRAQLGVARGFERDVPIVDELGKPVIGADGRQVTQRVADLPASQRFFAGGGTTVRGFDADRLGVPSIVNADGLSNGGNGLIIFNGEVRTALGRLFGHNFGVVGFVDAGNVFAKAADLDLGRLRGALGFGLRYDSPLGPVRLDLGFKLDRRVIGGKQERGWAYHLNIGEAF